eukprot:4071643-Pleurochrysis_carterae.AAC.1
MLRRSAPYAVPLSQPGALRCSDSHHPAPRVISHRRDVRLQAPKSAACDAHHKLSWTRWKRQGVIDRVFAPPVRARFVVNFAYWVIVVCREAKARPARYGRRAS